MISVMNRRVMRNRIGDKKGSSAVMLAIVFLGFAICIAAAIGVSRRLVVSSECEAFGRVWTKAILSEYDVYLLEDYSIMAYFGNDDEVTEKLNNYIKYSSKGKLDEKIKGANADLTGFELGDPSNFRKALKIGFASAAASELINGRGREYRGNGYYESDDAMDREGRIINNTVVLDTLPSNGVGGSADSDSIIDKAKSIGSDSGLKGMLSSLGPEFLLIQSSFDNHVTTSDGKDHFFENEWEYIIKGSNDDAKNYRHCRTVLFAARNALNLFAIYKDPKKVEAITAIAETITPGPFGLVTQLIIAEAWAALEAEADLKTLYEDGRVPLIKTSGQWKIGLESVMNSKEVAKELDDESKELLKEKHEEVDGISSRFKSITQLKEGLNYDEYLMLMIMTMNDNTRLLRIMDLVQINMKYRYYADFNMMEYYIGTRFTIDEGMRSHEFEDAYK